MYSNGRNENESNRIIIHLFILLRNQTVVITLTFY